MSKNAHGFFGIYNLRKGIDIKKFRKIEPTKEETKKLKIAVYCRVSTKFESQQSSIDLQISNYETVIQSNPQWEYAGVYFDYGSGLRQKGRSNLGKMINKACAGEIDKNIYKSISGCFIGGSNYRFSFYFNNCHVLFNILPKEPFKTLRAVILKK
ncbi:recombinase family protein [Oscillospiraceae bacterium PP1C4]